MSYLGKIGKFFGRNAKRFQRRNGSPVVSPSLMPNPSPFCFRLRLLACAFGVFSLTVRPAAAAPLPAELAPLFEPPNEYANQFGAFRSPLKFADGREVKTPADWAKRREEIRRRWHEVMGPWPALLEKPRLVIHEKTPRDNFTQCRIEVEIAAGRMAAGYLLIPNGAPKFPAVFVPYYDPETSVGLQKELRDFAYQLAGAVAS